MVAVLTDLDRMSTLFPADCVGLYKVGSPEKGVGAKATIRYDFAAMHRKLEMTVSRVETEGLFLVDWDHAGKRGFISRWVMTAGEGKSSAVKLNTPINAPPWPFAAYFFDVVQPEWQDCQTRLIAAVGAEAAKAAEPTALSVPEGAGERPAEPTAQPVVVPDSPAVE
jgi:hypothetical protein